MKSRKSILFSSTLLVAVIALLAVCPTATESESGPAGTPELTAETAAGLSALALHCIQTE